MNQPPASPHLPPARWPLPRSAREAIIVGGTFDPPHRAHIDLAAAARDARMPTAHLLFVPAATSPLKTAAPPTPAQHRINMLSLATAGLDKSALWTDEIDRSRETPTPSYTVDTLARAVQAAPWCRMSLLIGSDQAADFHRWREPREVLKFARILVIPRAPYETWDTLRAALRSAAFWSDAELDTWKSALVTGLPIREENATAIRAKIQRGGVPSVPASWLHPAVRAYITEHALYGAS